MHATYMKPSACNPHSARCCRLHAVGCIEFIATCWLLCDMTSYIFRMSVTSQTGTQNKHSNGHACTKASLKGTVPPTWVSYATLSNSNTEAFRQYCCCRILLLNNAINNSEQAPGHTDCSRAINLWQLQHVLVHSIYTPTSFILS